MLYKLYSHSWAAFGSSTGQQPNSTPEPPPALPGKDWTKPPKGPRQRIPSGDDHRMLCNPTKPRLTPWYRHSQFPQTANCSLAQTATEGLVLPQNPRQHPQQAAELTCQLLKLTAVFPGRRGSFTRTSPGTGTAEVSLLSFPVPPSQSLQNTGRWCNQLHVLCRMNRAPTWIPLMALKPQIAVLLIYILSRFVCWHYTSIWQFISLFKLEEI